MNTTTLIDCLKNLSLERPVFHSEADFQHELAMVLAKTITDLAIRLERPFLIKGYDEKKKEETKTDFYLDLFSREKNGERVGIELKYKTQKLSFRLEDEEFKLKSHAATNLARYDFLKDIQRLETLLSQGHIDKGYAIMLTNVPAYWNSNSLHSTLGPDFNISEGKVLQGIINWTEKATNSSVGVHRKEEIKLNHSYPMLWQDYSYAVAKGRLFRFTIAEVKNA